MSLFLKVRGNLTMNAAQRWAKQMGITLEEFIQQACRYQVDSLDDNRPDEPLAFAGDVRKAREGGALFDKPLRRLAKRRRGWKQPSRAEAERNRGRRVDDRTFLKAA